MPIISLRDNKKIDERETTKTNSNKKNTQRQKRSYKERVRTKWTCCAFKLGFLQLKCKVSLIFKSNLELVLSIILKQKKLYGSKHVAVECRCLKIWDLLSFLIFSSILVLKWR